MTLIAIILKFIISIYIIYAVRVRVDNTNSLIFDKSEDYLISNSKRLLRNGPSINLKDVRKILPIIDPLLLLSALNLSLPRRLELASASIRQNSYCVINFLRDSGHLIPHFSDE